MQIKETLSQGLKRGFEIKIPAAEIEKKLVVRLEALGKKVKIPGFRPGKVPLDLLKKRYKAEALAEVLEQCIDQGVKQTLTDNKLKPALQPKVDVKSYEEGQELHFEVALEILPTIEDINLDGLSFEKYVVDIPAKSVSHVLEDVAKRNRETRSIQKDRKTKKGDIVIIDFEGYIDDAAIEGGSGKAHPLELGSESFIPGFEDQLIGHDKGSKITVKVSFPKDYHEEKYAGKPARFEVSIIDIHEADPIVIDAALATKLGFESLEAMQEQVKKSLSQNYEAQCFMNTKRHVLDALAERFAFEVPQNMVEMEFENIWKQLLRELGIDQNDASNINISEAERKKRFEELAGKTEEELKKEYDIIAERRVRLGLLLAEIGTRNSLGVNNQELLNALMAKAREFPGQERQVFDFYRNNESAMASLRAPIFEDKVVNFILDKSKITEKKLTPEELEKFLANEEIEAEKKVASQSTKATKPKKKKES